LKAALLSLFLILHVEAFRLEFSKPDTITTQKIQNTKKTQNENFVKLKPKVHKIIINHPGEETKNRSVVKLNNSAKYNPNAISEALAKNTQNDKNENDIKNLDTEEEIQHIRPISISVLSREQFLRSLAVFNH
jgi:hypothetical protein